MLLDLTTCLVDRIGTESVKGWWRWPELVVHIRMRGNFVQKNMTFHFNEIPRSPPPQGMLNSFICVIHWNSTFQLLKNNEPNDVMESGQRNLIFQFHQIPSESANQTPP